MPRPATGQPKRMLEGADKEFDADIRRLLENTTVGFKYQLPTADDRNPEGTEEYVTRLYEFMVAESYIVQVTGGYLLTASGREYRKHLQRNFVARWWHSNHQWVIPNAIAVASLVLAVISLIVATNK